MDADIDALCKAMKAQAVKNARSDEQKAMVKDVGRQQLISWGVLIERERNSEYHPKGPGSWLAGDGVSWRRRRPADQHLSGPGFRQCQYG